ncbi:MAG: helix-hairpin-helix domain-containing protein [Bacteroidetes bacterium]|nr:helix-hairpin-helix domain-containing protein [Bacteroidota bacterium]
MWKRMIEFFAFAVWERNAAFALAIVALVIAFWPEITYMVYPPQSQQSAGIKASVDLFVKEYEQQLLARAISDSVSENQAAAFNPFEGEKINSRFNSRAAIHYFIFDPNKIGVAEWVQLGFSEKQAEAIERVKAKGFKFRVPEDLIRVNIIGQKNFDRLAPYVQIAPIPFSKPAYEKPAYASAPREKFVIDINEADSSLWELQYGIGPKTAQRIVKYRTRLGGFLRVEQVREVWGLPDSIYQSLKDKLVVKEVAIQKINVNEADVKTMGSHPYINFPLARVIESYRKEHGRFSSVEDIQKVALVTDSIYRLLQPYVRTE